MKIIEEQTMSKTAAVNRRRRSALLMLLARPLWVSGLGSFWLRSSGTVVRQGWVLSVDD
jgi:hypothetical protein